MLQKKSCGAIVYLIKDLQTRYLLLNYSASHWDFVKGGVEPNESEKQTVVRELEEETGITEDNFIDGFRESIEYFYYRQGLTVHKVVVLYIMEVFSEKVKLSSEHKRYIWLDYEHAIEKLSFSNCKDVLDKAHAFLINKGTNRRRAKPAS